MKNLVLITAVSVLSALISVSVYKHFEKPQEVIIRDQAPVRYTNYTDDLLSGNRQQTFTASSPTNFTKAAEIVTPGVVNIKAFSNGNLDWWSNSYGGSSGSGVIISPDGYIVTNNHVIEEGKEIEITLSDKRKYGATLIGTDPSTDLALLKIDEDGLPYLIFGNSDSVRVGEWVLAVGNPFNLESTVTAGIVSAKGRSIDILEGEYKIESFIQTDAAVNPGNSGGALVNTNGELVGINTAIITRSGRYEGYSFAIPANLVRKIIRDIKDFGTVQRGILGIGIGEVTDELAKDLGLSSVAGVHITRVSKGSGAFDAGLKRGDVIISINDLNTPSIPELQEKVARFRPGNKVEVEYFRDGKNYKADVMLKNKSNSTALVGKNPMLRDLGFELRDLTDNERSKLNVNGAYVISITRGSKMERTNMDPGFIITKVNDAKVKNVDDLLKLLKDATGKIMLEGVYENYPGEYYYAFPI
ncbi:MAG: serine protease Do [Saprospiraceae bacterium]|jgi:serine protease Do